MKNKIKIQQHLSENRPILSKKWKIEKYNRKRKNNINLRRIFIILFFISFFGLIVIIIYINKFMKNNNNDIRHKRKYKQDDLTLVTAYYQIPSKHSKEEYIKWMKLTLQLNCSMIIFSIKNFTEKIKEIRPMSLHNKTIFIELEIEDFYSYKKYINEFNKAHRIDPERTLHSVPLYLVWAEKCHFLKKAIINNYFDSTCFYWIDAGYFRKEYEIGNYTNNWPSTKKCYEDKRFLLYQIRMIFENEKNLLLNFDKNAHRKLQLEFNVGGGMFGGHFENVLKFVDYYYETIEIFANKNLFIGKEQNIFAFVALSHPEIVNLIYSPKDYHYFRYYLS